MLALVSLFYSFLYRELLLARLFCFRAAIKNACTILMNVGIYDTKFYEDYFEIHFLKQSKQFYQVNKREISRQKNDLELQKSFAQQNNSVWNVGKRTMLM